MTIPALLTASMLALLAVAHSALGESDILRPLFAAEWSTVPVPRWATERILRFAWHLTSFAWLGLAAIALGFNLWLSIAAVMFISAAVIFFLLRGHLAWPLFLSGGFAALAEGDKLPSTLYVAGAVGAAVVLVAASLIHLYWAFGGTWGLDAAVPTGGTGARAVTPGPMVTSAVAAILLGGAGVVGWTVVGAPRLVRLLATGGVVVLVARAIGDTKVAGFTKTVRDTTFAAADDRLFSPICVGLALGITGALLA